MNLASGELKSSKILLVLGLACVAAICLLCYLLLGQNDLNKPLSAQSMPEPFEPVNIPDAPLGVVAVTPASETPGAVVSIDENPRQVSEDEYSLAIDKSREWLTEKGYYYSDEAMPATPDNAELITSQSDFSYYSDSQLLSLAEQGDAKAQAIYGLRLIENNVEQSEQWFLRALTQEDYTGLALNLLDGYQLKIDRLKNELLAQGMRNTFVDVESLNNSIIESRIKMHAWSQVAAKLGDPLVAKWYKKAYFEPSFFEINEGALDTASNQANALINNIEEQRATSGFYASDTQVPDRDTIEVLTSLF